MRRELQRRRAWTRGAAVFIALAAAVVIAPITANATISQTFTGSVAAGGVSWKQHLFDVVDAGQIQATLDWDDPAANLNLFLYRKNADNTWTEVAKTTSTTARPEQITYPSGTVGDLESRHQGRQRLHRLLGERDPLTELDPAARVDRVVLRDVRLQRTCGELRVRR